MDNIPDPKVVKEWLDKADEDFGFATVSLVKQLLDASKNKLSQKGFAPIIIFIVPVLLLGLAILIWFINVPRYPLYR
ncbi:hypothetical protein HY008_02755 [Candidatus Woesebacteria bacterium]|nr:hypothetical protein [Candidatus Woesebacteria bacterium]